MEGRAAQLHYWSARLINESAFSKSLAKLLVPANEVKVIRERQARRALAKVEIVLKFYRALTYGHTPDQLVERAPGIVG